MARLALEAPHGNERVLRGFCRGIRGGVGGRHEKAPLA